MLRWTGAAAAVGAPVTAGVTWAAARLLTSTPPPRTRRPTLSTLVLDDHTLVVRGDRADDPGSWGLRLDDAFLRIDGPLGTDADGWVRRHFGVLDGRLLLPDGQTDRRIAHRRAPDRSSADDATDPATDDATDDRPLDGSGGQRRPRGDEPADEPGDPGRPDRERRRGRRDRRRRDVPPPWPLTGTLTPFAWPDDPQVLARHCDATFRIDGVRSEGHTLPVWILEPRRVRSTTWLVGVHGRGSPRTELFRLAAIALRRGHPVLIASYRTDAWTRTPSAVTTLGTVEWRDAEANLAAALSHGASRVVLAGCSLGGGLVAQVVRRSDLSPWVAGVVLDSPALSWNGLLRALAQRNRLPTVLVTPVMVAARLRAAVDWSMIDHLAAADEFDQPVLVLHGDQDDVVPIVLSEALATARPEIVRFHAFPGATHVTSWNHAPQRYERVVERFLARVTPHT